MTAPFPWFGGKRRSARAIRARLGDIDHYVEPFAGSLATLLAGPPYRCETVNDADGFICNFWRALQSAPLEVASEADWPVSEVDLTARHLWLVEHRADLQERLLADPVYYDVRLAGWWLWGIATWIGSSWCTGDGPWVRGEDGRVGLGNTGMGIHRQLPHLGDTGRGVHRQLPHLGDTGRGIATLLTDLAERLRRVRVACGDWTRVVTPATLYPVREGTTGLLLDPPYPAAHDASDLYAGGGSGVWPEVAAWCESMDDPKLRVVVCGYEGYWTPPLGWRTVHVDAASGYSRQRDRTEVLWCSPACVQPQPELFG